MPVATVSQEIEFLTEYKKNPHDYSRIHDALSKGIISPTARGRQLRHLHQVVSQAAYHPVWYDFKNKQWNVVPIDSVTLDSYAHDIANETSDWKKAISYGDSHRTNPIKYVHTDKNGMPTITDKKQMNSMEDLIRPSIWQTCSYCCCL